MLFDLVLLLVIAIRANHRVEDWHVGSLTKGSILCCISECISDSLARTHPSHRIASCHTTSHHVAPAAGLFRGAGCAPPAKGLVK